MNDAIYQKVGLTIKNLAQKLMFYNEGDQMPKIIDLENELNVSRGTVQNALAYLKSKQAIRIMVRGNRGSYISMINKQKLREISMPSHFIGIMPLLRSKTLEALATSLYETLENDHYSFALAHRFSPTERIELLLDDRFDFAIISLLDAEQSLENAQPIKIIQTLNSNSYQQCGLMTINNNFTINKNHKIGVCHYLIDQLPLIAPNIEAIFVPYETDSLIEALHNGEIDYAIGNTDFFNECDHIKAILFDNEHAIKANTSAIVIKEGNMIAETIFNDSMNTDHFLETMQLVKENKKTPIY